MARARFLRPEFFDDEKVGAVPFGARLLFQCMWIHCDMQGVCEWSAARFRGLAFRFDDGVTNKQVQGWHDNLFEQGMIVPFTACGKTWCHLPHFVKYQSFTTSEMKQGNRNPAPPIVRLESDSSQTVRPESDSSLTLVTLTTPASALPPSPTPTPTACARDDLPDPADQPRARIAAPAATEKTWMDFRMHVGKGRVFIDREGNSESDWKALFNRAGWVEFCKAWDWCAAHTEKPGGKVFLSAMLEVLHD